LGGGIWNHLQSKPAGKTGGDEVQHNRHDHFVTAADSSKPTRNKAPKGAGEKSADKCDDRS
jgi:hypothetical protein